MGSLMAGDTRYPEVLVRDLLLEQHPDMADLPLREVDGGWDNQLWLLGADLAVRLPRTEGGPALLRNEQVWLPSLAAHLPLPWIMGYDVEPLVTLESKRALLRRAVDERWLLVSTHDPFTPWGTPVRAITACPAPRSSSSSPTVKRPVPLRT